MRHNKKTRIWWRWGNFRRWLIWFRQAFNSSASLHNFFRPGSASEYGTSGNFLKQYRCYAVGGRLALTCSFVGLQLSPLLSNWLRRIYFSSSVLIWPINDQWRLRSWHSFTNRCISCSSFCLTVNIEFNYKRLPFSFTARCATSFVPCTEPAFQECPSCGRCAVLLLPGGLYICNSYSQSISRHV